MPGLGGSSGPATPRKTLGGRQTAANTGGSGALGYNPKAGQGGSLGSTGGSGGGGGSLPLGGMMPVKPPKQSERGTVESTSAMSAQRGMPDFSKLLQQASSPTGPQTAGYDPSPFTSTTQANPQLDALQQDLATYRSQMGTNSDLEAQQALQRERDLTSGAAKEFGENLAARGIMGSGAGTQDLMERVVEPGQQRQTQLNAQLSANARQQQLAALGMQGGLAAQQAQIQQAQQQFGLSAWQAQEQARQQQAQLAAMQAQAQQQNLAQLLGIFGNLYSGF